MPLRIDAFPSRDLAEYSADISDRGSETAAGFDHGKNCRCFRTCLRTDSVQPVLSSRRHAAQRLSGDIAGQLDLGVIETPPPVSATGGFEA